MLINPCLEDIQTSALLQSCSSQRATGRRQDHSLFFRPSDFFRKAAAEEVFTHSNLYAESMLLRELHTHAYARIDPFNSP